VKRDLKNWCITKKLTLDRREWKLTIHVSEHWSSVSSFYCILSSFFPCPFLLFGFSVSLSFLLFYLVFYYSLFSSSFSLLFCTYFFSHVVLCLIYPNLLENKRLDCCWCCFRHRSRGHQLVSRLRTPNAWYDVVTQFSKLLCYMRRMHSPILILIYKLRNYKLLRDNWKKTTHCISGLINRLRLLWDHACSRRL
jgi:hypothetical protein